MSGSRRIPTLPRRRQRGVILIVVLFFALLLTSSITGFVGRATIDSLIARNRENAARAEALGRGGVWLAAALLAEDALQEQSGLPALESWFDPWKLVGDNDIEVAGGATLRLKIEDAGTRLNLNGLNYGAADGSAAPEETEIFLTAFFEKVIEGLPLDPGEKALYEPDELAQNLIDWVDLDDERLKGGPEDAYYQEQEPPYEAANRPILSLEELRRIEGFDETFVRGLEPYVSVHPWAGGVGGINPNTAPRHVLAMIFYEDAGVGYEFASDDEIRQILEIRQEGGLICETGVSPELCTPISEVMVNKVIIPPLRYQSAVFRVASRVRVGDVQRTVHAVIDRSNPAAPRVLDWKVR